MTRPQPKMADSTEYNLWTRDTGAIKVSRVRHRLSEQQLQAALKQIVTDNGFAALGNYSIEAVDYVRDAAQWWNEQTAKNFTPKPPQKPVSRDTVVAELIRDHLEHKPITEIGRLTASLMQQQVMDVLVLVSELGFDLVRREPS